MKESIIRMIIPVIFLIYSLWHNTLVSGEYYIADDVPSILHQKFDLLKEDIFPKTLKMQLYISKFSGTLLYSIDKHGNQLIVSFYDTAEVTLGIEFRKKEHYFSLQKLCGCTFCKYKIINLSIEIINQISLQCNDGSSQKYSFSESKEQNEVYPLPYSKVMGQSLTNEAQLWFVNTPYTDNLYPNQEQLKGCIFNVWYNEESIVFSNITGKIKLKCNKKCSENICNKGRCVETYSERILCNCTETFKNGDYCNNTMTKVNLRSLHQSFQMTMFKISWRSPFCDVFLMNNSDTTVQLRCDGPILLLECSYKKGKEITNSEKILSSNYNSKGEYILIAVFFKAHDNIQFYNNGTWFHSNVIFPYDLSKEIFTSLTLRSNDGDLDFVIKTDYNSLKWSRVSFNKYENIKNEDSTKIVQEITQNMTHDYEQKKKTLDTGLIIGGIIAALVIFSFIILGVCFRKKLRKAVMSKQRNRKRKKRKDSDEEKDLLELNNEDSEEIMDDLRLKRSSILQKIMDSFFTKKEKRKLYLIMDDIMLDCHNRDKKESVFSLVEDILKLKKDDPSEQFGRNISDLQDLLDPSFTRREKQRRLAKIKNSIQQLKHTSG